MASTTQQGQQIVEIQSVDNLLEVLGPILPPEARGLTLSIYIEAGRTHEEAREARIRFKTEVLQQKRELSESERYSEDAPRLLKHALELVDDASFWDHQVGGLAFFSTPEGSLAVKCAHRFSADSRVSGDYHLLPLLEAAAFARRFYALGLAEGTVFLKRVSDLGEEDLDGIPTSFASALTEAGFTEERLGEMEFSNKNVRATEHSNHALRAIDEAVRKAIPDQETALLIAAVDFMADDFVEVSQYPNIAETRLTGDPERMTANHQLADNARAAMLPYFRERERNDAEQAKAALGMNPETALTELPAVVAEASNANLASLTIARGSQVAASLESGSVAPGSENLPLHLRIDMVDFVARRCLADGGQLQFVDAADLPDDTALIARTRWKPAASSAS